MTFQFQTQDNTVKVSFFLNLAKRTDDRDTVVGYCHNGMLICSPDKDTSWVQFAVNSDKQGWVPMELSFRGQTKRVNPEQFWTKLFGCESIDNVPNVKIKANIGNIDTAEELYTQGGCLVITITVDDINILGEKDYEGETSLYLRVNPLEMRLQGYYGTKVDATWVTSCLQESIIDSTNESASSLKRYQKKQQKKAQTAELKAAEGASPATTEDALLNL